MNGDLDGDTFSAYVEGGVVALRSEFLRVEPMVAFGYARVEQDDFTEDGSAALNLAVDDETVDSYVGSAGLRLRADFAMEGEARLLPEVWVRWDHEFGDTDRRIDARLTGATSGGNFVVRGSEPGRDSLRFGAGWRVRAAELLDVFVHYDGQWNTNYMAHGVSGGIALRW